MNVAAIIKKPIFLISFSGLLFGGLLCATYIVSRNQNIEDSQSQLSPVLPAPLEATPAQSQQSENIPNLESVEQTENSADTTSPSRSATNNSQTTINVSTNNGSTNTTLNVRLQISDDACSLEANGPSGTQLIVETKNDKKGGQQTYALNGTALSVPTGGMLPGMIVEARIVDPTGSIKASSSATIGPNGCN